MDDFHGRFRIYFSKGAFGVQLFFIVSAFTLFSSLESRSKRDRKPVHAFFVRRLFRIAPLFWLGTLFYLWKPDAWRSIEAPAGVHAQQIVTTLLFIHGWSAATISSIVPGGWSIAAEVMFYLCIPFLFFRIKTLNAALWLTAIVVAAVSLTFPFALTHAQAHYPHAWKSMADAFIERSFPAQLPIFCMGILLFFLLSDRKAGAEPKPRGTPSDAWFFVTVAAIILFSDAPAYIPASVGFLLLAYGLAIYPIRALVNPVMSYLGTVSYSVYIWHFFIIQVVSARLLPRIQHFGWSKHFDGAPEFVILFVIVLAVSLVAATASYYLVEVPAQSVGKSVVRRMQWGA